MKITTTIAHVVTVTTLALGASSLAQTADTTILEVQVGGPTRDAAYGQASEKGLEALVARVLTPGTPVYAQVLASIPRSELRLGRVVREAAGAGGVSMTVEVSAARGVVERAVLRAQPALAQTRIAVVIPEVILRRPVPDPAAETEIGRSLVESGLRLVDASQQVVNATREIVRASPTLNAGALAELRTRLNADVLITGEAFAEEYGAVAGGLRGYTARLEVKVIDLATGQVLHTQAFQGSAANATDALAGKTALMNVGKAAGALLPGKIMGALQGGGTVAPRAYVMRAAPPVTFAQINALGSRLRGNSAVGAFTIRAVDTAGASAEVQFTGSAAELAALLESLGVRVSGLTGSEITIQF
ncbi:hypothetical protein [Deinococcus arenicola]|uniref:Flagellar assembly protein T N-terminal domain-containing protein n=1 Tax=Deinococcus arenicola TaxID=2994950 RepID=A0ABU4DL13_9DEIO|nr:hypothetical protein [Deinococcus sp. ZS9-10]MDV6373033.1 hypothetical protein [Deinococcus sp. ZS9-10]